MRKHHSQVKQGSAEWPWVSFSPREIASKGDGTVVITPESRDALDKLQALRDKVGHALIVNSAHRDAEYNKRVGGARNSQHVLGIAYDISVSNIDPHELIEAAKSVGFTSFGTYPKQGFVHIDTRKTPARWGDPFPVKAPVVQPARKLPHNPQPVSKPLTQSQPVRGSDTDLPPVLGGFFAALGRLIGSRK